MTVRNRMQNQNYNVYTDTYHWLIGIVFIHPIARFYDGDFGVIM